MQVETAMQVWFTDEWVRRKCSATVIMQALLRVIMNIRETLTVMIFLIAYEAMDG